MTVYYNFKYTKHTFKGNTAALPKPIWELDNEVAYSFNPQLKTRLVTFIWPYAKIALNVHPYYYHDILRERKHYWVKRALFWRSLGAA